MSKIKIPNTKLKGEEKYRTLSIRIPKDLYDRLTHLSNQTEISRNEVITILLQEASNVAEIEKD